MQKLDKLFDKAEVVYSVLRQWHDIFILNPLGPNHNCSRPQSWIFFHCFCESSARKRIHMKHQALFSFKDKSEKVDKSVVCCNFAWHLNSLTTKKQTTKFLSVNLQKMLSPSCIILRIQRPEGKQCRFRWSTSCESKMFSNWAVFAFSALTANYMAAEAGSEQKYVWMNI